MLTARRWSNWRTRNIGKKALDAGYVYWKTWAFATAVPVPLQPRCLQICLPNVRVYKILLFKLFLTYPVRFKLSFFSGTPEPVIQSQMPQGEPLSSSTPIPPDAGNHMDTYDVGNFVLRRQNGTGSHSSTAVPLCNLIPGIFVKILNQDTLPVLPCDSSWIEVKRGSRLSRSKK